jgi:hypothetical protein
MNNIYLAQFTLRTSYYMEDSNKDRISNIVRIVVADSLEEARMKVHKEYKVDYHNYKDESNDFEFEYDYSSTNSFDDFDITPSII